MLRILLLCGFLFLYAAAPTTAQQTSGVWYFASNVDTGALAAYSTDGQSNILIESGVSGQDATGTRIGDDEALLYLYVDNEPGLYHVTPNSVERLIGEDGVVRVPLAYTDGAAVMVAQYGERQPVRAMLYQNGELTRLPHNAWVSPTTSRFSEDGTAFRYLGANEAGNGYALWNYDLASGTSTVIHDFETLLPLVRPDTHGDRWLWRLANEDKSETVYSLISLDGALETIGTFNEQISSGSVFVFGQSVVVHTPSCESECPIELRSADGVEVYQGTAATYHGFPISRTADGGLIIVSADDLFYRVRMDDAPELLGSFTRNQVHILTSTFLAVSPDARWLMTVDDWENPTVHNVIDVNTGEVAATYSFNQPPYLDGVRYGDGLVVLKMSDNRHDFVLYGEGDGYEIVQQPKTDEIRVYFAMLPNQTVLYRTARPYTGIYRHDLAAGTETVILEGAWEFINLADLR